MAIIEKDILMQKLDKQTGETIIMYPITKKENILGLEVEKDTFTNTNKHGTTITSICRRQGNVVTLYFKVEIGIEQFGSVLTSDFGFPQKIPEKYRPPELIPLERRVEQDGKYYSVEATINPSGGILGGILNTTGEAKTATLCQTFIVD